MQKRFVKLVCEAVNELPNTFHLAHLDLRLANICLTNESNDFAVKLIDLDRSQSSERHSCWSRHPGRSVMYKTRDDWALYNMDWHQIGMMMLTFLNNISSDSYTHVIPRPGASFSQRCWMDSIRQNVLLLGNLLKTVCMLWTHDIDQ